MSENKPVSKRCYTRRQDDLSRCCVYRNAAISAMNDSTAFDSMLIESNKEYMDRLSKADSIEYEILRLNMEKAETDKEREYCILLSLY